MGNIDLLIVRILHTLVFIALSALVGQGALALLAGRRRHDNFVYKLFSIVTDPVIKACRWITPKVIIDKHLPFVAFFLLFWLLILLGWIRRELCVLSGLVC